MSSDDRRLDVLRAIVEDYVATKEPVGSRALVERHSLGVSPATIRNDMAALEDAGYIVQPHTSAGRVPTDLGYRVFVDRLADVRPLSQPERRAIQSFLEDGLDLDDVVDRAVRLLAQLTHQVAVVQYPSLRRSALRHVELVPVGSRHVLVVIITDTGRVEQRTVELEQDIDAATLAELRSRLAVAAAGRTMHQLAPLLTALHDSFAPEHHAFVDAIVAVVMETMAQEAEERIVVAGTANLAREASTDFAGTIGPVLEALEEQVVLLRLITDMGADEQAVSVRIGRETQHDKLVEASIVTTGYGTGEAGPVARIGSIGPLRMDYAGTMSSVRAVARYLSRVLAG